MSKWLSTGEAARILGTSRTTVKRLVESHDLLGRYHSGAWRILRAHVESITAGVMILENKKQTQVKDRAEYFRQYQARRKELQWPKCKRCKFRARKLADVGCLECHARKQPRREWGRLETDMIELYAGKDDPAHLQLRIYHESGQARTRWAIKSKWGEMGVDVLNHQDGYTIAQLAKLTGRPYRTIHNLIVDGTITNIGRGHRILVSTEDGEKVIARYKKQELPPAYSVVEAAKVLGCTRRGVQSAIANGAPSWRVGGVRYVCKATIDRAVKYLRETGNIHVRWGLVVP